MSKKNNNRVSYRPKYPNGGINWNKFGKKAGQFAANTGRAVADTALTSVGASNVIQDSDYKGNSANMFSGSANVVGGVGKAALPIAASALGGPMAGMAVSAAQNQIGQYNPQAEGEDGLNQQQMGQGLGTMANMGMQFYNMGQGMGQNQPSGIGMYPDGGTKQPKSSSNEQRQWADKYQMVGPNLKEIEDNKKWMDDYQQAIAKADVVLGRKDNPMLNYIMKYRAIDAPDHVKYLGDFWNQTSRDLSIIRSKLPEEYPNGGINVQANAELENQENFITPNGEFGQVDGNSHKLGGVPVNIPEQTIIFSDRLKPKGFKKTYAQLNKVNNTNREDKVLDNKNSTIESKKTAELMKKLKNANSDKLFQDQEQAKQNRLAKYMQKHGMKFPDGGIKTVNTYKNPRLFNQAYSAQGYQEVPGFKGRMYNPANYDYVEYAPIPKYSDKPFVQPDPSRQPMQFTGSPVGPFNPNIGNYIGPNGLPVQQQSFSFAKGGIKTPWYKGIGDALNGEIEAGRLQMTDPTTSKIGELDPLNTPYEEPIDWRQAVINSQDNPNVLRDYLQTPNSGKQVGQLESNKEVNFNPYVKGASRNSLNPNYNQPNNRYTNWQDPAYYAAGTLAQSAGPLAYLAEQGKRYDTQKFYDYNPERLDPSAALRDADIQAREGAYSLANASGGNSGSYLSNRIALAGQNTLNKASIRNQYDNMNAGINNQGQQFNIGNRYRTDDINADNKGQALTNYYQSLGQVGTNVASGMRDYRADSYNSDMTNALPQMINDPQFREWFKTTRYYKGK